MPLGVRQSEVLANLTKPMEALLSMVNRGELARLLVQVPRPAGPVSGANRRLASADIDQLVADYAQVWVRSMILRIYTACTETRSRST